jgi:hypothetical protein
MYTLLVRPSDPANADPERSDGRYYVTENTSLDVIIHDAITYAKNNPSCGRIYIENENGVLITLCANRGAAGSAPASSATWSMSRPSGTSPSRCEAGNPLPQPTHPIMPNHELNVAREYLRRTSASLEAFNEHHRRLCNQLATMRTLIDPDGMEVMTRHGFDRYLQTAMSSIAEKSGQVQADLAEIQAFLTVVPFQSPETSERGRASTQPPSAGDQSPLVNTSQAAPAPAAPGQADCASAPAPGPESSTVTIVIQLGDPTSREGAAWMGKGKVEAFFRQLSVALRNL